MAVATGTAILGAAALGTVGGLVAGGQQAAAAGSAAQAQERQAQSNLAFAKESRDSAVRAADSPQELAALERSLQVQERNIGRSERLLQSVDPTLAEASQQALRLLRGEEAAGGGVLREQRKRERAALVDRLRKQLGPGAETSSAGIQALTQFDQSTSGLVAQNQQRSLGQLLGTTQAAGGLGRQESAAAAGGLRQTAGLFGSGAQRRVNAFVGGGQQIGQAAGQATGAAGSQFVQAGLAAQNQQQAFGNIIKAGTLAAVAGGGFGGGGGGNGIGAGSGTSSTGGVDPRFGNLA